MKYSLRFLLLFLVAAFPTTHFASMAMAQDKDGDHEDGIRITINGKELEIDEEQIEEFFEESSEEIEEWAERHAEAWEKWAEKFESKMERWAEESEEQWEKWAEKYSGRWEKWGEKLEAGEIKGEELGRLMENNLEMLSEMPLGDLIEGALKNSLGDLDDAPFESLDELGDIVGGAIEQSIEALENELQGGISGLKIDLVTEKQKRRNNTDNVKETLKKLQYSLESKRNQLEHDADKKLARMKKLLARKKDLDEEDIEKIVEKLKVELMESNAKEMERVKREVEKKGRALQSEHFRIHATNAKAQQIQQEVRAKLLAGRKAAMKAKREKAEAMKKAAKEEASEMDSLEAIYKKLKSEKEGLEKKESAIEEMRREIRELRKEIDRMKKKQKSD